MYCIKVMVIHMMHIQLMHIERRPTFVRDIAVVGLESDTLEVSIAHQQTLRPRHRSYYLTPSPAGRGSASGAMLKRRFMPSTLLLPSWTMTFSTTSMLKTCNGLFNQRIKTRRKPPSQLRSSSSLSLHSLQQQLQLVRGTPWE